VTPFILLDNARTGTALLYRDPQAVVRADRAADVPAALAALRGHHAAGFIGYEAGAAFEPRLTGLPGANGVAGAPPMLWFGLFGPPEPVNPAEFLPDPAGAWIGAPEPLVARTDYLSRVAAAQAAIRAGDIYQANISFPAAARWTGDVLALYAGLRRRAGAAHGALVFTGEHVILSLSPELFFTLDGGVLTARPMKGTAPPGSDPALLAGDPKQRAENLMIVDLLRNDLARIAVPGSVAVPELFRVEAYPTVQQMVSTVTARIRPGCDAIDALAALFPCGSITGAPKIRAMEVIAALEQAPRGVYTGAVGRIDPDGGAAFNVAIRTLVTTPGADRALLAMGSGIVADSDPADEWRECLSKGAFVASDAGFDLIETIAFDPEDGLLRLEAHLARLKASAAALGFAFNRHAARNELQAATFRLRAPARVRLLASAGGSLAVEVRAMPPVPPGPVEVALADMTLPRADLRRVHKTSDRAFYDDPRRAAGTFEVAFVDAEGFLTEGSFTNLFVERDGTLLTPPLSRGLLPGVLRAELIAEGRAREADLVPADLGDGFLIGNALRGLLRARLRRL